MTVLFARMLNKAMEIVIKTIEFGSSVLLAPFKTPLALAAPATVKLSGLTEITQVATVTVKQFVTSVLPRYAPIQVGIRCRERTTGQDYRDVGQTMTCNVQTGGACWNHENTPDTCRDYEVQLKGREP